MQVAIDLRSDHEFWAFASRHRAVLSTRFPAVTLFEITDAGHAADLPRLAEQLNVRARTPAAGTAEARLRLAEFDVPYFTDAWRRLLCSTLRSLGESPTPR